MKKKILAAALASVMALTNVSTVFAVEKTEAISGDLTVNGFLGASTGAVEMTDGDSYTFKFHNKSNGTNNWENFILGVTDVVGEPAPEVLLIRADRAVWAPSDVSDFPKFGEENPSNPIIWEDNIAWADWISVMSAGVDVEATIARNGDTLEYSAKIGEWTAGFTATSGRELPESLYVFLSGENCTLTGIETYKDGELVEPTIPVEPEDPDETEGYTITVNGFLGDRTNSVELKSGDSYTFKFHNKSNGTNNWENFILGVSDVAEPAPEVLLIRADRAAWAVSDVSDFPKFGEENPSNPIIWEDDIAWADWISVMSAGVDVEATIARNGDTLEYSAKIGEWTIGFTATSGRELPETLYAFLSGEECTLTGIKTYKNGELVEPTIPVEPEDPDKPEQPEQPDVPEGAIELGNLTVTNFFGAKTDTIGLKSGESCTLKFNSKSNGTNNWDNFVLAVGDLENVNIEGYNDMGGAHEALVIRADSWGWGGGLSDFVAPDLAGNRLAFSNNVDSDFDNGNWQAGAREGYDVELTISRYNNTLAYDAKFSSRAKAGDYNITLKATSGKALPEDLYVFMTGENCVLSNIIATKATGVVLEEVVYVPDDNYIEYDPSFTSPATPAAPADVPELGEENTDFDDLTVTTFFAEKTKAIEIKNGESYTIKFYNKSNGTNNWENFVLAITGEIGEAYTGADQEILVIRADSWGWGGGYSDFVAPGQAGNALVFDTNIDWDKWVSGAKAGYDVNITLTKSGNTLEYDATIGDYYVKLTATSGKALPDTVYAFLTGENCVLSGIKATKSGTGAKEPEKPAESEKPTEPEGPAKQPEVTDNSVNLGNLTVTDFFGAKTGAIELKNGGSYTFKFNNKSNGTNNWENFVLAVTGEIGEAYTGADQEILVIRADSWGWGGGYSDFVAPDQEGNALVFDTNIDWDKWQAGARAGYDVEITIGKNGNTITYDAKIGDYYVKLTATSGKALPESAYVFFTGENCVLSGITATNNNPEVSDTAISAPPQTATTPAAEETTPAETAKPAVPISLGDLTVTDFFGAKTSTIELKSGDSYSIKFNNKSNGTNNWDNFVLAIAGATGAAYTGADQEVLVIRADNWGWGGGYSDFVAPNEAGNALVFDTNIDWDNWVAGAQAGYDVNITLTRSGNTLRYYATIGNYYVKLTATSGKALPETLYVFLTGENCVLSGITAVSLNDVSPNTGVAAPCALAVLAIASAATLVIFKKKSA